MTHRVHQDFCLV